jgi:hypothetical protein
MQMKAHEARLQQEDHSEVAAMFSKLRIKSDKRKQTLKSQIARISDGESNASCSDSEQHRCRNWRDSQESSRCHKVVHIAQYCPSTAQVESTAQRGIAAAAAAATTTTSIGN